MRSNSAGRPPCLPAQAQLGELPTSANSQPRLQVKKPPLVIFIAPVQQSNTTVSGQEQESKCEREGKWNAGGAGPGAGAGAGT